MSDLLKQTGEIKKFISYGELEEYLKNSNHIKNALFEPGILTKRKLKDLKFENFSFSKTKIEEVTFHNCEFIDCLFIGTDFVNVSFHECNFKNCNFFKSSFENVYGKPIQFRKAITNKKYSNIAVHLYQQLRNNYYNTSQKEFKNEAEYYFNKWNRINELMQLRRKSNNKYAYTFTHFISFLYYVAFGYGYRARNTLATAFVFIIVMTFINHNYSCYLFQNPEIETSVTKSIYLTITTMSTLGASGYTPDTETGFIFVIINVILGITLISAAINALFKKIMR